MKKLFYVSLIVLAWLGGALVFSSLGADAEIGRTVGTLEVAAYTDTFSDPYDCLQVCRVDSVQTALNPMYFEVQTLEVR